MQYLTWDDEEGRSRALAAAGEGLARAHPVVRSARGASYLNVAPRNVSVREDYGRRDYDHFRPGSALPLDYKQAIQDSLNAYESSGIVHNVIDLMSDFAVQGMDISHPNVSVQRFYKEWWARTNARERSERFLCALYLTGNVVVRRVTATLGASDESRLRRANAGDVAPEFPGAPAPREIPWRWNFLNPTSVQLVGEHLAPFIGADRFRYTLCLPQALARMYSSPSGAAEERFVRELPADVKRLLARGDSNMPLDPRKVNVYHYKRLDWQPWAMPMLRPVLPDIQMLEKLKLADISALDGAISSIRVWKMGSLEHKIMPDSNMVQRLAEVLANNVGGGVMDLIWGPDLELQETSTDVHRFLGQTKYEPHLNALFQGLGIPPTLSGSTPPGGFTNNFLSLKTLTERLEYGRNCLRQFWANEIRLVQKAMNFQKPATVVFDRLMTDESAEKALLIQLADRDLISVETLQERFGLTPEIEEVRARREQRKREKKKIPRKASPFHEDLDAAVRKIMAQSGAYAPSEFGLDLAEKKQGQKTPLEAKPKPPRPTAPGGGGPKGQPSPGRPRNSDDTKKRKQKAVKPRRSAAEFAADLAWAEAAFLELSRAASRAALEALGKKTLRELTDEESEALEDCKFGALMALPFGSAAGEDAVALAFSSPFSTPQKAVALYEAAVARYASDNGRAPPFEVARRFRTAACVLYHQMVTTPHDDTAAGPGSDGVPPLPRAGEEPAQGA